MSSLFPQFWLVCVIGVGVYPDLLWLADTFERNPGGAHHGVPDQTLVPNLNNEAQIQSVDLTEERGKW